MDDEVERLQAIADELAEEYPNCWAYFVVIRDSPHGGIEYWAEPLDGRRHFGDVGEILGSTPEQAERSLRNLY